MSGSSSSTPKHLEWLFDTGRTLKTADGRLVQVFELRHAQDDEEVLSAWGKHFRAQYCDDCQIDSLRSGTGLSRADYLKTIKFPDQTKAPGPSIRAGDFAEVLIADYVEFSLGYWLPRTRYDRKAVRNESTKGSDIIGFKILTPDRDDPNDTLVIFEAKAQLTGNAPNGRLQAAIDGSAKDELRKAESLNAIKQRFLDLQQRDDARAIERFQNSEDRPHREEYGAAALVLTPLFDETEVGSTNTSSHPHSINLRLIVIHGLDLMGLVHELYRRAADEA